MNTIPTKQDLVARHNEGKTSPTLKFDKCTYFIIEKFDRVDDSKHEQYWPTKTQWPNEFEFLVMIGVTDEEKYVFKYLFNRNAFVGRYYEQLCVVCTDMQTLIHETRFISELSTYPLLTHRICMNFMAEACKSTPESPFPLTRPDYIALVTQYLPKVECLSEFVSFVVIESICNNDFRTYMAVGTTRRGSVCRMPLWPIPSFMDDVLGVYYRKLEETTRTPPTSLVFVDFLTKLKTVLTHELVDKLLYAYSEWGPESATATATKLPRWSPGAKKMALLFRNAQEQKGATNPSSSISAVDHNISEQQESKYVAPRPTVDDIESSAAGAIYNERMANWAYLRVTPFDIYDVRVDGQLSDGTPVYRHIPLSLNSDWEWQPQYFKNLAREGRIFSRKEYLKVFYDEAAKYQQDDNPVQIIRYVPSGHVTSFGASSIESDKATPFLTAAEYKKARPEQKLADDLIHEESGKATEEVGPTEAPAYLTAAEYKKAQAAADLIRKEYERAAAEEKSTPPVEESSATLDEKAVTRVVTLIKDDSNCEFELDAKATNEQPTDPCVIGKPDTDSDPRQWMKYFGTLGSDTLVPTVMCDADTESKYTAPRPTVEDLESSSADDAAEYKKAQSTADLIRKEYERADAEEDGFMLQKKPSGATIYGNYSLYLAQQHEEYKPPRPTVEDLESSSADAIHHANWLGWAYLRFSFCDDHDLRADGQLLDGTPVYRYGNFPSVPGYSAPYYTDLCKRGRVFSQGEYREFETAALEKYTKSPEQASISMQRLTTHVAGTIPEIERVSSTEFHVRNDQHPESSLEHLYAPEVEEDDSDSDMPELADDSDSDVPELIDPITDEPVLPAVEALYEIAKAVKKVAGADSRTLFNAFLGTTEKDDAIINLCLCLARNGRPVDQIALTVRTINAHDTL